MKSNKGNCELRFTELGGGSSRRSPKGVDGTPARVGCGVGISPWGGYIVPDGTDILLCSYISPVPVKLPAGAGSGVRGGKAGEKDM